MVLCLVYSYFLPLSREPIIISVLNPALSALLFLIAIFLPLHGQISLVAISIFLEYALKLFGVILIKVVEAIGKRRQRSRSSSIVLSKAASRAETHTEKNIEEGVDEGIEEETIGDPQQISKDRKDIRVPGLLYIYSTLRILTTTFPFPTNSDQH